MRRNFLGGVFAVGVAGFLIALSALPRASAAVCVGDCNNNGAVTAGELTKIIAIINLCDGAAAGCAAVPGTDKQCTNADKNGNGVISAGELTLIIQNINTFASGCAPDTGPTATPTNVLPTVPPTNALPTSTPTNALPTSTPTIALPTATPTTAAGPPLGDRVFHLNTQVGPGTPTPKPASGFFSSLAVGITAGIPQGTLVLSAGGIDATGHATVTLGNAPAFTQTDISLGGISLCTKLESCTGTLNCNGGANVDLLVSLDSLRPGLSCLQNGVGLPAGSTNLCVAPTPPKAGTPTPAPLPCCSNACEGICSSSPSLTPGLPTPTPCTNSGNSPVTTVGANPGTDSGSGAMAMLCMQRIVTLPLVRGTPNDCTTADYSTATLTPQYYTTGNATAQTLHHCAQNTGASAANKVPKFAKVGTDFSCANWTTANGPGVLAFAIPSEEGSDVFKGDGANAGLWSDK
jgi:hypothetical protein